MRKVKVFLLLIIVLISVLSACSKEKANDFVLIEGGTFVNENSNFHGNSELSDFYISKYEVTQKEWIEVMGTNPSDFIGDNLPVNMVSWYDCIEYCNKRSIKEGLDPHYTIDKNKEDSENISEFDDVKWIVTVNEDANGYRLPTEAEWEYAASGGHLSKGYRYSGSDMVDDVAWNWKNVGDEYLTGDWNWPAIENNNSTTKAVGDKEPNEFGLYDMSGNVREWCWDWYEDENFGQGLFRVWKGGGWIGGASCCEISYRGKFEANGMGSDQGFRVCRNKD